MTITAKTVLKDKFWILEDESTQLGTLSCDEDIFMFNDSKKTMFFTNTEDLHQRFGFDLYWKDPDKVDNAELLAYGFPTSVRPHNIVYDIKHSLPLFSKTEISNTMFCAGYYIVKFNKGWVKSFCPKLITLSSNTFVGPFKTDYEAKKELSNAKRNSD